MVTSNENYTHMFAKAYASRNVGLEEIKVDTFADPASYGMKVRAEMDSRVVGEVAQQAIRYMANKCSMPETELFEFIRFLREDPEIHSRYIAYKTAKRLRGE